MTEASSSEEACPAKMIRIYLVDSLAKGRITQIPLSGNTIFQAGNGAGKTSRLKLTSFFLGAEPHSVVSKGKLSFEDFYLPRSTSYLAMDYVTADGEKRCVVAYIPSQKLVFRFVDGHFSRSWISEGTRLVAGHDFTKQLQSLDVPFHPKQLETFREYRMIIQGCLSGVASNQERLVMRGLVAKYSLAGAKHPLPDIDKIILGMAAKKLDLDALKGTVLSCVENDGVVKTGNTKKLAEELGRIDQLVQQSQAIGFVSEAEPFYEQAEEAYKALLTLKNTRERLKYRINLSMPKIAFALDESREELSGLQNRQGELATVFGRELGALQQEMDAVERERDLAQKKLDTLESSYLRWQEEAPEDMEARAKSRQPSELELDSVRASLQSLEGKHADLNGRYNIMRADEREASSHRKNEINDRYIQSVSSIAQARSGIEQHHEAVVKDLREKFAESIEALRVNEQAALRGVLAIEAEPDGLDAAMQKDRNEISSRIEISQEELTAAKAHWHVCSSRLTKARAEGEDLHRQISKEKTRKSGLESEVDDLKSQIEAGDGTFLSFLRKNVPSWESTLGKVISVPLLQRKDLSPSIEGDSKSVMGVALSLDGVQAAPDLDGLKVILKSRQDTLTKLIEKIADLDAQSALLVKDISQKKQDDEGAEIKVSFLTKELQALREERASLIFDQDKEVRRRQDNKASRLKSAQDKHKETKDLVFAENNELEAQMADIKSQRDLKIKGVDDEQGAASTTRNEALQIEDQRLKRREKELTEELKSILEKDGVSDRIIKLQSRQQQLSSLLKQIRSEAEKLQSWEIFRKNYPVDQEEFQAKISASSYQFEALSDRIVAKKKTQEEEIEGLKKLIKHKTSATNKLEVGLGALESQAKGLEAVTPQPYEGCEAALDPDILIGQIKSLSDDTVLETQSMNAGFQKVRAAFLKRRSSEVFRSWDSQVGDGEMKFHDMREFLSTMYGYRLQAMQNSHYGQLTTMRQRIADFSNDREVFHSAVSRFGREIRKAIKDIHVSESIEELKLDIQSHSTDEFSPSLVASIRAMEFTQEDLESDSGIEEAFIAAAVKLRDKMNIVSVDRKPKDMISITGSVIEKGQKISFDNRSDFNNISSGGLSTMIQCAILLAFIHRVRKDAPVELFWCLDELGTIEAKNVEQLMETLKAHGIHLITAIPNPTASPTIMDYFRWMIEPRETGSLIMKENNRAFRGLEA